MAQSVSIDLSTLLAQLGQAGKRLSDLGAAEGAAGNMSVCVRGDLDFRDMFPNAQVIDLPLPVPELAGASVIVTGSGRRLREVLDSPLSMLKLRLRTVRFMLRSVAAKRWKAWF